MTERLDALAKEINHRLASADTASKKAEDNRLTAAIRLAEARMVAEETGTPWRKWVAANIKRSYRDVKRLVAIGQSADPAAALASARAARRVEGGDTVSPPARIEHAESREPRASVALPAPQAAPQLSPAPIPEQRDCARANCEALPRPVLHELLKELAWRHFGERLVKPEIPKGAPKLIKSQPLPPDDPETGEIYEQDPEAKAEASAPALEHGSGEDPSTGTEARGQSASRASGGAGTPATNSVPPAGLSDEDFFDIPDFLDRRGEAKKPDDDADAMREAWS